MSTTSKLNPKRIAIKKKLHRRLGLTNKPYLPLPQKFISDSNRNTEWSVPNGAFSMLNPVQDVRSNVFFINTKKSNQDVRNFEKRDNSTSQQGDLFQSQKNKIHHLNRAVLQYLQIALGHSSMRMTEFYMALYESMRSKSILTVSKRLESVETFYYYFGGLQRSETIEEDNL